MALMVAAMSEKRFFEVRYCYSIFDCTDSAYEHLFILFFRQDHVLIEHGAACLAAMSLRSPGNSAKIVECGAIEVLVRCMRAHSDKASMQRQGTPYSPPHYGALFLSFPLI
jgi:Armadillo/beta-catenin-like repeat